MRKLLLGLVVLLVSTTPAYAQTIGAFPGVSTTAVDAEDLTAATGAAPFDYALSIGTNGASAFTWQTIYSVAPSTVTVLLQGSTDCSTYATVDTSTNVNGEIRSVFGSWRCIRINNTVVTGGAGKTLTVKFVYSTGRITGTVGSGIFTGGTFTSPILLPDGTAANPALGFASEPTLGFYRYATGEIAWGQGGFARGLLRNTQLYLFSTNSSIVLGTDVVLARDAANTLAMRSAANPQTFNIYSTYTDASNYERFTLKWDTNVAKLFAEAAGTGTARIVQIGGQGGYLINFAQQSFYPTNVLMTIGVSSTPFASAFLSNSIQGSKPKVLTDAGAAVAIERVAVPTNGYAGMLTSFTANSTDGTNRLTTTGLVSWAGADTAGTPTCGAPVVVALSTAYKRANTLICTFTNVVSTTNCDLSVTCTDNLAGTQTMDIEHFIVSMPKPNTYAPQ